MTSQPKPSRRPRRQRFYYEIHLRGAVVDGTELWYGMLEAEREVERKSKSLVELTGKPLRGALIMRLNRRPRDRRTN